MKTLRPIPFHFPANTTFVHLNISYEVPSINSPEKFSKIMKVLVAKVLIPGDDNSYIGSPEIPPAIEHSDKYFEIQQQVSHCVNNAEELNARLRSLLQRITKDIKVKQSLLTLPFMELRDLFSDFLKTFEPLKKEERFNTNKKIKNITTAFHHFITDRNIFTHGSLHLLLPENILLLEHIEKGKVVYSRISTEILISHNKTYKLLLVFLGFIDLLLNPAPTLPEIKNRVQSIEHLMNNFDKPSN